MVAIKEIEEMLCDVLGNQLAKYNIGIMSGGGKPGMKVAESLNRILTDSNQYEPTKIITVFRKKNNEEELKIKRIGCIVFVGKNIDEMRDYLFANSRVLIVIGGATKTKEEVLLAQQQNMHIIPVAITGGTAYNVWLQYNKSRKYQDETLFAKLNNKNPFIVSDAIIFILKSLILND